MYLHKAWMPNKRELSFKLILYAQSIIAYLYILLHPRSFTFTSNLLCYVEDSGWVQNLWPFSHVIHFCLRMLLIENAVYTISILAELTCILIEFSINASFRSNVILIIWMNSLRVSIYIDVCIISIIIFIPFQTPMERRH